jgi:hypothetical protein
MGVANVGLHVGLSRERKGESENDERGETKCSRFFAVVGARLEWWWRRALPDGTLAKDAENGDCRPGI